MDRCSSPSSTPASASPKKTWSESSVTASPLARTATASDCTAARSQPKRWAARCTRKAPVPVRVPRLPWRFRSSRGSCLMQSEPDLLTHRVLVIDDNPAIHQDYRKILVADGDGEVSAAEAGLFGAQQHATARPTF